MTMELLTRELGGGFAMGDGAQLLLAVLAIAFLCGSKLRSRRLCRRLQRSTSVRGAPLDFSNSAETRMVTVTTSQLASSPSLALVTRFAPHGSQLWRGIACKPFDHARATREVSERRLHLQSLAKSRDTRIEAWVSAMGMREYSGFAKLSFSALKGLNTDWTHQSCVPAFARKFIDEEQSLARKEAVDSSCDTYSTGGKKLDADKKDTNGVLWGLLRNFLRAACLHLAAFPRSLLTSFSSLATEVRRGSNHLTSPNNLIVGDMKILFFCSIGFHFISGANAQDHTDNGKPVDPEAWKTSDNSKAAAMFLLASSIGGVGVVVWILYNRRRTFSLDDIDEGLMRSSAVVRRDDPTFELLPSIEPWSDTE